MFASGHSASVIGLAYFDMQNPKRNEHTASFTSAVFILALPLVTSCRDASKAGPGAAGSSSSAASVASVAGSAAASGLAPDGSASPLAASSNLVDLLHWTPASVGVSSRVD